MKKFDSIASEDQGEIGKQLGSVRGVRSQVIARNSWKLRITVQNEWEVFILLHYVCMSWTSVDLSRKYTRWMQEGPKCLWIGPCISWLIFSTLMGCWWNRSIQQHYQHYKYCLWLVWFHQQPINVEKMGQPIQIPIQRRFRLSHVTFHEWVLRLSM